ncbi:MAG: formylglycine-generating enzyme family protein [Fibrobacter sp.]|nr:formylglycine-generating enzyme family protein [Fibrobacter sp.]
MNFCQGNFIGFVFSAFVACFVAGCSVADGEPVELTPATGTSVKSSSSVTKESSSSVAAGSISRVDSLVKFVKIPAMELTRGSTVFNVDSFEIAETEVTQKLYSTVMNNLPDMDKKGDSIAVANVTWYDAILFCNAFSGMLNLDTAYVYDGKDKFGDLNNLEINYKANAIRLPTETEWEIAARAGSTSTYFWGNEPAGDYAYYAQTSGPVKVAQYMPNDFGLYDVGGNVAEWVNDWYDAYPLENSDNPSGPNYGEYKVVRGGGWSEKVTAMASGERSKKLPTTQTQMIGFRVVHSTGF